jgi:hypothetical protein
MTARRIPQRRWRSYDSEPLPTPDEALGEPFRAFPSWYLRITCDRCGKDHMLSETDTAQRDMRIRYIIARMRHDGCGGRAATDHRHRGRQEPAGAAHRAGRRLAVRSPAVEELARSPRRLADLRKRKDDGAMKLAMNLLDLSSGYTRRDVELAYRRAMQRHHRDRGGDVAVAGPSPWQARRCWRTRRRRSAARRVGSGTFYRSFP